MLVRLHFSKARYGKFILRNDVEVFSVAATSFPAGVQQAWDKLHNMLPETKGRIFYGISYMNQNKEIIYKAAVAEAFTGEAERYGCEKTIIQKGEYISIPIHDWHKNIHDIGPAFQKLIADPRIDKNSFCVEWYKDDNEMLCMIKTDSVTS